MGVHYTQRWNIVESYNATVTSPNPTVKIGVGSVGGDGSGGTYQHQVWYKGTSLYSGTANRSYRVSSYRQTAGTWSNITNGAYDVYGLTTDAQALNTFLTNMTVGDLLVLTTYDEPANNKSYFDTNLRDNFGAARAVGTWDSRSMYILVAVKGKANPIYERYERRYFMGINATLWLG